MEEGRKMKTYLFLLLLGVLTIACAPKLLSDARAYKDLVDSQILAIQQEIDHLKEKHNLVAVEPCPGVVLLMDAVGFIAPVYELEEVTSSFFINDTVPTHFVCTHFAGKRRCVKGYNVPSTSVTQEVFLTYHVIKAIVLQRLTPGTIITDGDTCSYTVP